MIHGKSFKYAAKKTEKDTSTLQMIHNHTEPRVYFLQQATAILLIIHI
jgi:hypothetical protein